MRFFLLLLMLEIMMKVPVNL